jgi:hypothetical protein
MNVPSQRWRMACLRTPIPVPAFAAGEWLDPVRLHGSGGFSRIELRKIGEIVTLNRVRFMEAWHDYFAG